MIEKIMKAVKSSNKKRGRNITVGAVIGFLLSCTGVMGADEFLWIKGDSGKIEFNTEVTTTTDGSDGVWNIENPYEENSWDGTTYINNIILSSSANNGKNYEEYNNDISYGLKLSGNLGNFNFINNGIVSGTISDSVISAYGIYIDNSEGGVDIENEGQISGTISEKVTSVYAPVYGIYIDNSTSGVDIKNEGQISGTISEKVTSIYAPIYGIYIDNSTGGVDIKNEGQISGTNSSEHEPSYGIYIDNSTGGVDIKNEGQISVTNNYDSGSGYGIYIGNSEGGVDIKNEGQISVTNNRDSKHVYGIHIANSSVENITNTGVIYAKINAIKNDNGTVTNAVNYGILANGSNSDVVDGLTVTNYGLIIKNGTIDGKVETKPQSLQIEFEDGTREMAIENKDDIKITASFSGDKTNHILNGLTDTYKANTGDSEVTDSIINAYGTAVVFDTDGGKLTLSGTTVNGGLDGTSNAITGGAGNDVLVLQSGIANSIVNGNIDMQNGANTIEAGDGTVINGNITTGTGNDVITAGNNVHINGNIDLGDGENKLTIGAGSTVNGTLKGGAGNDDILQFGTAQVTRASNTDETINVSKDITGFENINVGANVTFASDLTITDTNKIVLEKDGVLTLRIDSDKVDSFGKITGHALYDKNDLIVSAADGGKMLLDIDGAKAKDVISFGKTALESLVPGDNQNFDTTSKVHTIMQGEEANKVVITLRWNIPEILKYDGLNGVYHGIGSVNDLIGNFNIKNDEQLTTFIGYLNNIYAGSPYSYSSELSRKSAGMFRDIVTENQFKANTGKWMIYGGLTHVDGGTKDTYYGKGYYTHDIGSSDIDGDTKITGAYMLGEYGVSDTLTSGVVIGGNKLKSDLSNGSKVDGSALYLGAYAKKYIGNLKVTAGAGFQYGDYDADRLAINKLASEEAEPVMKYSDNYNDMTYDIYLNGRYSHNIGENLFLEPYGTLSYTYIDQDGADEGSKVLGIETDSKSFDYTTAKVGADLKKVIPHEKGKSTLSAGVSYTKILDGADEEHITGRFKGGTDFDILVAHKNEHSIGLNAKYALELENGVLFDVKGTYSVERDSNNNSGKNKTKGEWIVGAGMGYKF
ncbi:autotransporter domain-containing protein [Fusobacterium ulcerans]|uniref:autotransporter family protein n=1 Tax=Fusobacterium ulcerans TaxID=861 RepID=UPI0030A68ED9